MIVGGDTYAEEIVLEDDIGKKDILNYLKSWSMGMVESFINTLLFRSSCAKYTLKDILNIKMEFNIFTEKDNK